MHALDPVHSVMKDSVTQSHTEPSLCSAQHRLWWRGRGDCKSSFCLPQLCVGQRPAQPSAQTGSAKKTLHQQVWTPEECTTQALQHVLNYRPFLSNLCQTPSLLKGVCIMFSGISPTHLNPVRKAGRVGHTELKCLSGTGFAFLSFRVTLSNSPL